MLNTLYKFIPGHIFRLRNYFCFKGTDIKIEIVSHHPEETRSLLVKVCSSLK